MQNGFLKGYVHHKSKTGRKREQHLVNFKFKGIDATQGMQNFTLRMFSECLAVQAHSKSVSGGELSKIVPYPFIGYNGVWRKGWNQDGGFTIKRGNVVCISAADS